MPSQLTFDVTKYLRDTLIVRNLTPYTKEGAFTPSTPPVTYEYEQNDYSVIDSPDSFIDDGIFANELYPTNKYGPDGGYDTDGIVLDTIQIGSNEGPYKYNNANILEVSEQYLKSNGLVNIYSPVATAIGGTYDQVYTTSVTLPSPPKSSTPYSPYWGPPSFTPSGYEPIDILNKAGDTFGNLKNDSQMMQDSANALRNMLQYRLQQNLETQTVGRFNILDALDSPASLVGILDGRVPLVEGDWRITRQQTLIGRSVEFLGRLGGLYYPGSTIPGDYFEEPDRFENNERTFVGRSLDYIGSLFGLGGRRGRNPSQLFLDNTGAAQKRQLSRNLKRNKYRPTYVANSVNNPVGSISRLLGVQFPEGNYYVGSATVDATFITSPPGQIPLDANGRQVDAPVYGPEILAKDFDPAAAGIIPESTINAGGVQGGLTWTSKKFGDSAGTKVGPDGSYGQSESFNEISSQYDRSRSTNYEFTDKGILYHTQKLIDSQPPNGNRYAHAGNAIDQVSKIFHDGYKEITKGSRVISYVNENGFEQGREYCRIFTKDIPYMTFSNLQKTEGNIRKFDYSVLNNTFNLNIAPYKGENSTNIVDGKVKKYMFSIENLAWRTSSKPGFNYDSLPVCEKGQNGGRIMWFPPYGLEFSEDVRADFNSHSFLGRPEPVYTYKNTSRGGSLKWKIIVDHPSILNVIVNKVLANETNKERVDSIIDSFFSGCKKYDIYDLAIRYPSIPISELQLLQSVINNPASSEENVRDAYKQNTVSQGNIQNPSDSGVKSKLEQYSNMRIYFPLLPQDLSINSSVSYEQYYNQYINNSGQYGQEGIIFIDSEVRPILNRLQTLVLDINEAFKNNQVSNIKINLKTTTKSRPLNDGSTQPELDDPSNRFGSLISYFKEQSFPNGNTTINLSQFINDKKLIINELTTSDDIVITRTSCNCINRTSAVTPELMGCTSISIDSIVVTMDPNSQAPPSETNTEDNLSDQSREGITKRLLRNLLSECDYFDMVKEESPMIYDSIKEKLKYFQPAFHSITPEGLNSRLTFLQQCMRPGETIPIIGPDGELTSPDATNTSFGAPPILVLRVGDFFNTKIVPTSLSIRYENLDLNPEGIGVQPMIADVTMSFHFIGGHGLKEPVERLQNALSFNYYANTEMYDERSIATDTDFISKMDKKILESIISEIPPPAVNDEIVNDGGNTIGNILSTTQSESGETGTISYLELVNELVNVSQNYITTTIDSFDYISTNYNPKIFNILSSSRNYTTGVIGETNTDIFGKSSTLQNNVDNLFNDLINGIKNETLEIFNGFTLNSASSDNIRSFKRNYINYLNNLRGEYTSNLYNVINNVVNSQEKLVGIVNKTNFIVTNHADASIQSTGDVKLYRIATGDVYDKFLFDVNKIGEGLNNFNFELEVNGFLGSNFNYTIDDVEILIIYKSLIMEFDSFANVLSLEINDEIVRKYIREFYLGRKVESDEDKNLAEDKIKPLKNNENFQPFTPILENPPNRTAEYEVTQTPVNIMNQYIAIYNENTGGVQTYNGKLKFL